MNVYVVDTSSLRTLKDSYPIEFFESLWELITRLNEEGRIILIRGVKDELVTSNSNDYLSKYFFNDKYITNEKRIPDVVNNLALVMDLPPQFKGSLGIWIKKADPWIIAQCIYEKNKHEDSYILTGEKIKGQKLRIPFVAQKHNITCVDVFEFFRAEGIKFSFT